MSLPNHFVQIDEEGFGQMGETRITDENVGRELLNNIHVHENRSLLSKVGGTEVLVEAFDEPIVAQQIDFKKDNLKFGIWTIQAPYNTKFEFSPDTLSLDEWDRFHGYTKNNIPFVLSRKAQAHFFNLLDSYTDDSITMNGSKINIPNYWGENNKLEKSDFWENVYIEEKNPRWNLNSAAEALKDMLPRLKLPKSKIIVLGCGEGHDAALFAESGHAVTAVDFSEEAITRARKNYSQYKNIDFQLLDVFNLPNDFWGTFDIVFEHTCFCAVNPTKRSELVKIWSKLLNPHGQIMAILFAMEKREGPPYGGSEWEYRARLKDRFQFLFWGRWKKSLPRRQGRELFVLAKKK